MRSLVATACLAGLASIYANDADCIDKVNDPTGLTYDGNVSRTKSGFKCARWGFALKRIAQNSNIKRKDIRGGYRHNGCRNPDGDKGGPWCFTLDRNAQTNWEHCNIEECANEEWYNYDDDASYDEFEEVTEDDSGSSSSNNSSSNNNSSNTSGGIPQCGIKGTPQRSRRQTSTFIVGGEQAYKGELPWQVHLRGNRGHYKGSGYCGGSIINDRWILTASHCIVDQQGRPHSSTDSVSVAVGWYASSGTERDLSQADKNEGADFIQAKRIITHPNYNPRNFANDIALIELTRPIKWGKLTRPICLPTEQFEDKIERENFNGMGTCLVSGWGDTRGNPAYSSELLAKAEMPIITNLECGRKLNWGNYELPAHSICAMHLGGGQDSCQGDSGGPLVCQSVAGGNYAQLGVVSWGYDCGKNSPGVYARTSTFNDWIKQTAGDSVQFI